MFQFEKIWLKLKNSLFQQNIWETKWALKCKIVHLNKVRDWFTLLRYLEKSNSISCNEWGKWLILNEHPPQVRILFYPKNMWNDDILRSLEKMNKTGDFSDWMTWLSWRLCITKTRTFLINEKQLLFSSTSSAISSMFFTFPHQLRNITFLNSYQKQSRNRLFCSFFSDAKCHLFYVSVGQIILIM